MRNFFHVKLNTWVIVVSTVLIAGIYFYYISLEDLIIFPGRNDVTFDFYNDGANGGKSEITEYSVSDSIIRFDFDLKEGFSSPYVGINTWIKNGVLNLVSYNRFQIEVKGDGVKNISFCLFTPNTSPKIFTNSKEFYFFDDIKIAPQRKRYYVNLNRLKVPDWWNSINDVSPNERIEPDLQNVIHFNIGTVYTPKIDAKRSLRIYSMSFGRDNKDLTLFLITGELAIIFLLVIIHYLRAYLKKQAVPITIAYKPVDIENENRQLKSYLDYINNNFHDHDLTLEHVSDHTGINQRRIANSIQQTFGCNFKTYVNQLRINESKRLLIESGLNMGEIAFKVGFSNQSHFNRVFKSLVGISPSEFRENKQ